MEHNHAHTQRSLNLNRHQELVWELSALHLHWLSAYDPEQHGSGPIGWMRDFAAARERLREWVAASGTKLDRDRPTRLTIWPGDKRSEDSGSEVQITDRDADFLPFVFDDVDRRRCDLAGQRRAEGNGL